MTDKDAKEMIRLLKLIAGKLGADEPKKTAESGASVSSVTKLADGRVIDNTADDVPRQVEGDTVTVGPMARARRVTRIRDRQGDPR